MQAREDVPDLQELKQAFLLLASASRRMEISYERLKEQTEALKRELKEKNERLLGALREQRRLQCFLDEILQNLPVGVVVTDPEGRVRLVNQRAREILGCGEEELEGRLYAELGLLEEIPLRRGVTLEKRRGRAVFGCTVSSMDGTVEGGSGWIILIEDLTEVARWKALAERQKRLSSMGEMGARIAHEIRNPLGSMELNATMLLEELKEGGPAYDLACRVATGVRSVTQILDNLLHFAKGTDAPRWEVLDVVDLVRETLAFSEPLLREKGIRADLELRGEIGRLFGDRVLLRQALLNLVRNAVEGMEPGGELGIAVRAQPAGRSGAEAEESVRIEVRDTGRGIPEEDLDRIFDPFFTTKSQGTGLGLAIVNHIVERHGGIVEVESREGRGSCFVISLPCRQEEENGHAAHPGCG